MHTRHTKHLIGTAIARVSWPKQIKPIVSHNDAFYSHLLGDKRVVSIIKLAFVLEGK